MDLSTWVDPDAHGWIVRPKSEDQWNELIAEYGGNLLTPLARIVEAVRLSGCRTVVIENRYVDVDYRSEYSAFWCHRFEGTPAFARRLHFFATDLAEDQLHSLPPDVGYLGYSVIRPVAAGAVGRT